MTGRPGMVTGLANIKRAVEATETQPAAARKCHLVEIGTWFTSNQVFSTLFDQLTPA
jgi:hypothetical protein